jgi:hypothetical protein
MANAQGDRFSIPLIGRPVVTRCYVDASFGLLIGDADTEIRIGGRFLVRFGQKLLAFTPDERHDHRSDFGSALDLYGMTIEEITAFEDGALEIVFEGGTVLSVPSDAQYEPWELVSKDGRRIVSLPGGGLAKWSPYRVVP